jgi:misacylated tRNA(Ala) deacylase
MATNAGLYLEDPYARSFEAHVMDVDGDRVALDRTVFCPGELGQMPDRGWLRWGGDQASVAGVRADGGFFWHQLAGDVPPLGTAITGELDWTYRHRMMRTHTAFHLVSALTFYLCGGHTIKSNVLHSGFRFTVKTDCTAPTLSEDLQLRANAIIAANLPVYTYLLSRAEALETPLLNALKIRMMPPHVNAVRVVEIEGVTLDIDTGTHVRSTREIGGLHIARAQVLPGNYLQFDLKLLSRLPDQAVRPLPVTREVPQRPYVH